MAYATREEYAALYGDVPQELFDRLAWEAERIVDDAVTGVDGVCKLRSAFPADERDREAVKRCVCALVETLRRAEERKTAAQAVWGLSENGDGTVCGKVVTARSAGSESVSYAVPGAGADTGEDPAGQRQLDRTVRQYLAGARDANGVGLLYGGRYPARL